MLICIEGCIGVGKTTLTHILCKRFSTEGIFEDFENNPFLVPYYQQPQVFAFHVQLCFLLLQHAKLLEKVPAHTSTQAIHVSDFSIIKNEVFSKLTFTPEHYTLFTPIYSYLGKTIKMPDLIIHLYGSVPLIMDRIQQRAHPTDVGIKADYISQLSSTYRDFFELYSALPTISISIDIFDCMKSSHVDELINDIHQKIGNFL